MSVGDIKNMTSQLVSHYEKNSGVGVVDAKQTGSAQTAGKSSAQAASPDVKINLSAKSQDFVQIQNVVAQLPEIREEKVRALKAQIESGAYSVDSAKIAGKMVQESLLDIFA